MGVELIVESETARYKNSSSFEMGVKSKGGEARYFLSSWNAFSYSSDHSKALRRILKNGRHQLVA